MTDKAEAFTIVIDFLVKVVQDEDQLDGYRLEAAREVLKYASPRD